MYSRDFVRKHAEVGLVVFWNLLPDMPRDNSVSADEPLTITRIISESLLVHLIGLDDIVGLMKNVLEQLQSLSSKIALATQVKGLDTKNASFLSDADIRSLEELINNQILSTNADELAGERHPAQVLMFSARHADPPTVPLVVHDSPKLTFALLWDCQTRSNSSELGSRAVETKQSIDWETLVAIHGDGQVLSARVESLDLNFESIVPWIESEFGISFSDARSFLQSAKTEL